MIDIQILDTKLAEIGVKPQIFRKIYNLALHNPDPLSFGLKGNEIVTAISPFIPIEKNRIFIQTLKTLEIYNVTCMFYEDNIWTFVFMHPKRGRTEIKIDRFSYHPALKLSDGLKLAILRYHHHCKEVAISVGNTVKKIEDDIVYD